MGPRRPGLGTPYVRNSKVHFVVEECSKKSEAFFNKRSSLSTGFSFFVLPGHPKKYVGNVFILFFTFFNKIMEYRPKQNGVFFPK